MKKSLLIGLSILCASVLGGAHANADGGHTQFRAYWQKGGGNVVAPASRNTPWKISVVKKFASGQPVSQKDWVDLGHFLANGDESLSVADTRALVERLQKSGNAIELDPAYSHMYLPFHSGYGGPNIPGRTQIVSVGARVKFSYFAPGAVRPTNGTGIVVQLGQSGRQDGIRVATVGPDGYIHSYGISGTSLDVLASGEGAH